MGLFMLFHLSEICVSLRNKNSTEEKLRDDHGRMWGNKKDDFRYLLLRNSRDQSHSSYVAFVRKKGVVDER